MIAPSRPRSRTNRIRLELQSLDTRDVPAVLVDLTTKDAQDTANGAIFKQVDPQPTGSGVIHSFLRVQANGKEQGYNTDARPLQLDENKSPTFTRSLTVGEVPVVTIDNVKYREFLLDINQKSSSPLLSLDELRLYIGTSGSLTGYNAGTKKLAGLAPVYDMDSAGDVTVKMNYRLNPGSGGGDVTVLIPDAAFAGASAGSFVYLYSKFGATWGCNAGFEEWAVRSCGCVDPPPPAQTGTASLSGKVVLDANNNFEIDAADTGLVGIQVDLLDANGVVVATTNTNPDGTFTFTNLQPGTYGVLVVPPLNAVYGSMFPTVGSEGGNVNTYWSGITDVQLNAGESGINYVFGLYPSSQ